ncbi:protein of unknown function (DUF309) [Caldisphaera lagunensis DSM 15908]|uniref:DUF309 domain-containing protein n=1 Tax=Caldisphaera lagunensis (strain DSM 15908 / JCM 11604 / ANMR 0165 / IC-154) TaxID=1056495 RepID=L0A9P0_CALLD|nr:DUF309 domain-containing protein [Caldisphaera lagunensis]AFZ70119.1 protein of unknown function (DUF309) [Caldisphaera lagunensis DSM 15908]
MDRALYIIENNKYSVSDLDRLKERLMDLGCPHGIRISITHIEVVVFCKDSKIIRDKITKALGSRIIDVFIGEPEVKEGKELSNFIDFLDNELFWLAHTFMETPWKNHNDKRLQSLVLYAGALAKAQENELKASLNLLNMAKDFGAEELIDLNCAKKQIDLILKNKRTNASSCLNLEKIRELLRN